MRFVFSLSFTFLTTINAVGQLENPSADPIRFSTTKSFRVQVKLDLKRDTGQSLGTLFQINRGDSVLAAAGFEKGCGNAISGNDHLIHFFINDPAKQADIENIGNPFPNSYGDFNCFSRNNQLLAVRKDSIKIWNEGLWQPVQSNQNGLINHFIQIENDQLIVSSLHIKWNNKIIYQTNSNIIGAEYAHNSLYVIEKDLKQNFLDISVYPFKRGNLGELKWKSSFRNGNELGYPLAWLPLKTKGLIISTSQGYLIKIEKDFNFIISRKEKVASWQGYSMLFHGESILLGQYPTGSIEVIDPSNLAVRTILLPVNDSLRKTHRELQSLSHYSGNVYAGLWPWGELYESSGAISNWKKVERLFTYPELSNEDAPLVDYFKFVNGEYNNHWGQRIRQLVICDGKLYAVTSNKNPSFNPHDTRELNKNLLDQYGRIYEIDLPGHLSADMKWKRKTKLEFGIQNGVAYISQGRKKVFSKEVGSSPVTNGAEFEIKIGKGIYGSSEVPIKLKQK